MTAGVAPSFWRTVWLLLKTSRLRTAGRQRRRQQMMRGRGASTSTWWADIVGVVVMVFLHGIAAFAVISAVKAGQQYETERQGKFVVSGPFIAAVLTHTPDALAPEDYAREAKAMAENTGGDPKALEVRLRRAVASSGDRLLTISAEAAPGLTGLARSGRLTAVLGSGVLLWWLAMLICQGEGLDFDVQRRRDPIWEWLFSHPVGAGAVFLAEMLSPIPANPAFWTAPLFVGVLYGAAFGPLTGLAALFVIGVPLTAAAACVGKSFEIAALLRLAPRRRGAVIGLLSWFGYAAIVGLFFASRAMPLIAALAGRWVAAGAAAGASPLGLFLGLAPGGGFAFWRGALFCWAFSAVLIAGAVLFSARSVRRGLSGAFAAEAPPARARTPSRSGGDPLFRKEYLWFARDRSAFIQAILMPLTLAGVQLLNLRTLMQHVDDSWNYLAGAAIFFGTYFLWVLGPKSLTSEGPALWISLTWPRGLESILKAKARLWSAIASALVIAMLAAAAWLYPRAIGQITLVGLAWLVFARSMAEKSVTLVTVAPESGEMEKVPSGRRWAAQLGMFSFAIGVCTQQWNLAIVGIVYSWITAAAMWQALRARLPFLYDPWSETLPKPPTLMHAMVSISILIEVVSVVTAAGLAMSGKTSLPWVQGVGYAVCAIGVAIGVARFLARQGVTPDQVWRWRPAAATRTELGGWIGRYVGADRTDLAWLVVAVAGGLALGVLAHGYMAVLRHVPALAETFRADQAQRLAQPALVTAYAVIAIGFAPFAEEYLFRGLLFKSLDEQWGGWRAVAGAAAFFAIYHPPIAWAPVALVGAANCLLFKRSGRLAPAVLLHMAYNTVATLWF
jgi:membrane protease YdiL (CAAX protease family)